jgi:hypothetical protein
MNRRSFLRILAGSAVAAAAINILPNSTYPWWFVSEWNGGRTVWLIADSYLVRRAHGGYYLLTRPSNWKDSEWARISFNMKQIIGRWVPVSERMGRTVASYKNPDRKLSQQA